MTKLKLEHLKHGLKSKKER